MRRLRRIWNEPARAFGIASVVLLVSLAIAAAMNHFSEWRHYQHGYANLISGRDDAVMLSKHMKHGIQQIWIPEQGVVDRCTTCHQGLKETSLRDVQEQPFRAHPVVPHSLTEFGCVTCHRGQGPMTTVREAHFTTPAWEDPVLPAKYIESGCGQCHLSNLTGTPQLNLGRQLLSYQGCVHCHAVKLPDGTPILPHDHSPSLEHIADKTTREWMSAWIKDPHAYSSNTTMPTFHFKDEEIRDISAFLVAQSTPSISAARATSGPKQEVKRYPSAAVEEGEKLYAQFACASCHAIENQAGKLVGGDYGPELTNVGSKVDPQWLERFFHNPHEYFLETRMPHYEFTPQQIASLSAYMLSKEDETFAAGLHFHPSARGALGTPLPPATSQQIAHGKQLVAEYGCPACHQLNGVKAAENFAPDMTRIGSRPLAHLAFAPNVPHTLPDFISAKIRDPRAFGPGLKMAEFKLTEQQLDALTTALLAQTDRAATQPPSLRAGTGRTPSYRPAGEAGAMMEDLRCFDCHRINGRGGPMGPDLSWEGSAVQRQWLAEFLKNPRALRPALNRRMPKFNLNDEQISMLTDYMMTVYQNPDINRSALPVQATPALVEQGRELFYDKYACQSCHVLNAAQDKGNIGPVLSGVGARLTPAWIYKWLKTPQALRPNSMEPNQHMSDDDARALTAFLTTQKAPAPAKAGAASPKGGAR